MLVEDREVGVFLTRSIRRKAAIGMSLVIGMLLTLSISGLSGLRSFRSVLEHLEFSTNQAPRQTDLSASIGLLFGPLLVDPNAPPTIRQLQLHQFPQRCHDAELAILEFRRRLERMPPSPGVRAQQPVTWTLLREMEVRLNAVKQLDDQLGNSDPAVQQAAIERALHQIAYVLSLSQKIPDPTLGLSRRLQQAEQDYEAHLWIVSSASVIVLLLFAALATFGFRWIFQPIRTLHRGARRVAQGDFNYRIHLTTQDEMSELADVLNSMTERFQQITANLDRQVCERSNQLVRSERLAGVGFLAAGVAHEINNPLSAIVLAAESLERRIGDILQSEIATASTNSQDRKLIEDYLQMIQSEEDRCRDITAKLLDFSRGKGDSRQQCDLVSIVSEVVSMVSHLSKFQDRTVIFERTSPCHVECNGPEIKQVVLNFVANALEATGSNGRLEILVQETVDEVSLVFQDNGCGMTPEVMQHLFEPFYTQKTGSRGTGLGLSISHRIVTDHGGRIDVSSEGPGQGSTFTIRLPRRPALRNAA